MLKIETIKASDAPPPPKKLSKGAEQILTALQGLGKDDVLKISPDEGKSVRGLKTSIGRVASNAKIKIEQWDSDGSVFVKRV